MRDCSFWVGLVGFALLAGCSVPYSSTETGVAHRLIPLGDYSMSSSARFYDQVEVARWSFSDVEEIKRWTPERIDILLEPTGTGLRLRSSSADPSLFRSVEIDASTVKAIRVHQAGLTSDAYMQLYWAGKNEPFSEKKTLGAAIPDQSGALVPSFTFRVRDHKGWKGDITNIRIDPISIADRRLEIYSIIAFDEKPNEKLIERVSGVPWRVDINGDVRTSMLTPPGFDFQTQVKIPKHASLDFSIGLEPRMTGDLSFEILIQEKGGAETPLFQETITGEGRRGRHQWHDRRIDLSSYAGKKIRLRFRTTNAQPLDLFDGFPAWANIEVTTPLPLRPSPPKNVVLIIADTLRADHLSSYGCENLTSPHIDQWAKSRGILFETAVAAAPWTVPSHASLFTGLDCLSHGANTGDPMSPMLTTMAELLAANGYRTHAVTGGAYLSETFGLMQGFDVVQYWQPPTGNPADAGDDIVSGLGKALDFLESNANRPFFLLFHTYEVHTPYRAREPYFSQFRDEPTAGLLPPVDTLSLEPTREEGYVMRAALQARYDADSETYTRISDSDIPVVRDLYDSGVAFADAHIGQLLDRIDSMDLNRNTIVVFTSDHGEALGEHGQFEHKRLTDNELLVPLIIASPDHSKFAGSRVSAQVRLIDVLPSVLELADLPEQTGLDGQSLVPLMADTSRTHPEDAWSYASSSNSGLSLRRENSLKFIFNNTVWPEIHGTTELYDLEADPRENSNLAPEDSRAPRLYSEAAEEFDQRTTGVRVMFSNQLDVPMEAHLKGHIVDPLRVTGFGVKTEFLEWRYQMLNMIVPPHHSMVFHLEGNPFGELYVTARFDVDSTSRTGVKHVMNLHQYSGPWQSVFDGRQWQEDLESDLGQETGIRIWIQGPHVDAIAPASIDQESRLLLQKLGYVH